MVMEYAKHFVRGACWTTRNILFEEYAEQFARGLRNLWKISCKEYPEHFVWEVRETCSRSTQNILFQEYIQHFDWGVHKTFCSRSTQNNLFEEYAVCKIFFFMEYQEHFVQKVRGTCCSKSTWNNLFEEYGEHFVRGVRWITLFSWVTVSFLWIIQYVMYILIQI